MINIIVPLAGEGKRFADEGYPQPKPLMMVGYKTNIEWSMSSLHYSPEECKVHFIIRADQELNYDLGTILKHKFPNADVITIPKKTGGSVETCLYASQVIDNDSPLVVYCPDIYFEPTLHISEELFKDADGVIPVFKANSPNYSYVEIENGLAKRTAEKQVISPFAAVGIYLFSKGSDFISSANRMIQENNRSAGEFYICPLYNYLIQQDGKIIQTRLIEKMHVFGTPAEYEFFVHQTLRTFKEAKHIVALCSDHSGFEVKELMKEVLTNLGLRYIDFGTLSSRDCDYVPYVKFACDSVLTGDTSIAFGFCRSGQGVNITANKILNIRAALVHNSYTAAHAIKHNCANFMSIPAKYVTSYTDLEIICSEWLENTFDGGRHQNRLQKLNDTLSK